MRRLPSDWRSLDEPTRKDLKEVIGNALKKLTKMADSFEKNPDNLFKALSNLGLSVDEVSDKAEEVSKRLPKPPSLGKMLKGA